jgi:hypothetical protein
MRAILRAILSTCRNSFHVSVMTAELLIGIRFRKDVEQRAFWIRYWPDWCFRPVESGEQLQLNALQFPGRRFFAAFGCAGRLNAPFRPVKGLSSCRRGRHQQQWAPRFDRGMEREAELSCGWSHTL